MFATDPADPVRHWPLAELVVRTPRLELRPDDDAGLAALADRAIDGVHPADEMPFLEPWTDDAGDPGFARGIMQYAWRLPCGDRADPLVGQLPRPRRRPRHRDADARRDRLRASSARSGAARG